MALAKDGGFYVLESRLFEKDNSCNILLTKLNASGDSVWSVNFNGNQFNPDATAMHIIPDNENILLGYQHTNGPFSDTKFALINSAGKIQGDTIYTLDINDFEDITSITGAHDGGFVMSMNAGKKNNNPAGYLVKVKANLSFDWKIVDTTSAISKVIYHSSGSYITIGGEKMTRYNLTGTKVWKKIWPNIHFNNLTEISDSSIIAVCQGVSMQMVKVSPTGKELLKKDYSGTGNPAIYPNFYAISETNDKRLLLAGSNNAGTSREYFFAKTSKNGTVEMSRTFYGPTVDYVNRFVSVKSLKNNKIALLAKFDNNGDGYDDRSAFYLTDSLGIVRKLSVDKDFFQIDKPIVFDDGKGGKGSLTFSQLGSLNKFKLTLYVDSIAPNTLPEIRFIKRFADIDLDSASGYKAEMNFPIYQDELRGIQPGALTFLRFEKSNNAWQSINVRSIAPSLGTSYIANLKQITQFSRWSMGYGVNSIKNLSTKSLSFKCYPNPGKSEISILFESSIPRNFKAQIIDVHGSIIGEKVFNDNISQTVILNEQNLVKGSYFIKITESDKVSILKYLVL